MTDTGTYAPVRLSYRLEYAPFVTGVHVCRLLGLDASGGVMAGLARAIGPFTPLRRRADRNLQIAMPTLDRAERRAILAGMFDNFTRTAVEFPLLPTLLAEPERITVSGSGHYETALTGGRGAVLITGHLGNWEAIRIACARIGEAPALIYRGFNNPLVDRDARAMMSVIDAPVVHKGRSGTLALLRHLRSGGTVMILTDQRFRGAPELPFFGQPATTSLAAAELAQRYGVPLIPVRGVRRGRESRFDVGFDAPISAGTGHAGALDAMTAFNARLEGWIRETPGQYFWFHNRWGKPDDRGETGALQ